MGYSLRGHLVRAVGAGTKEIKPVVQKFKEDKVIFSFDFLYRCVRQRGWQVSKAVGAARMVAESTRASYSKE